MLDIGSDSEAQRFRFEVLTEYWFSRPHFRLESSALKQGYQFIFQVLTLSKLSNMRVLGPKPTFKV
jgi:hypothetical protein